MFINNYALRIYDNLHLILPNSLSNRRIVGGYFDTKMDAGNNSSADNENTDNEDPDETKEKDSE